MQLRQLRYFTTLARESYFGPAPQTGATIFYPMLIVLVRPGAMLVAS